MAGEECRTPVTTTGDDRGMSKGLSRRWRVLQRDSFTCRYCGRAAPDVILEVDHIEPRARGGSNHEANLITACWECNQGKSARDAMDALVEREWIGYLRGEVDQLNGYADHLLREVADLERRLQDAEDYIADLRVGIAAARERAPSSPIHIDTLLHARPN